jgi:hypothetical protein
MSKNYFEVEKSKFIINEIVKPISKSKMLDLTKRENI